MHHTFTLALLGGLVYFLVWWLHRRHQQKVHAHYREQHAQERIRRTNYDISNPHQPMHPDEQLRRAEWEGEHGHLMSAMDIKNREEGRWPLGNAFQGLAGLFSVVVTASANMLVTNAGPAHTTGAHDAALMAQDRTPSLRFTGLGTLPDELQTPRPWQSACPP